jgi:uncharacterized membrane protein (UPF0127 family)
MRSYHPRIAALALALAAAACSGDGGTGPSPGDFGVTLNGARLTVGIASTNAARAKGLQGVTSMPANSGLLFVFADDRQRAFWMKDTPIPLSIAFLDANKRVIFLADMTPNSTATVGGFNAGPMRYAIEANQGWFAAHGVTIGTTAVFTLPSPLAIEPDA